jgi:HEAT repeat protein
MPAAFNMKTEVKQKLRRCFSLVCAIIVAVGIVFFSLFVPHAQRSRELPVNVTGISSRTGTDNSAYTIMADGALTRAQTWQDGNEFNVVLYRGQSQIRVPRGVQARRVGDSLMLTFPVRPGASVTVQPHFNRLDLVMSGGEENVQSTVSVSERNSTTGESLNREVRTSHGSSLRQNVSPRRSETVANDLPLRQTSRGRESNAPLLPASTQITQPEPESTNDIALNVTTAPPPSVPTESSVNLPATTSVANETVTSGGGWTVFLFSSTGLSIFALVALLLILFLLHYRNRNAEAFDEVKTNTGLPRTGSGPEKKISQINSRNGKHNAQSNTTTKTATASNQNVAHATKNEGLQKTESRSHVSSSIAPAEIFGAVRVNQEVMKLSLGEAHQISVLSSRAADDRHALEASLIKALHSPEAGAQGARRVRTALEEYGFVARLSATALLGRDIFERATAARALGEIKSPASLPFLLEALHDREQTVRVEAVASIGALKSPAAIGALIDAARRYPDIPANLLSDALTACSVESLNFFDAETVQPHLAIAPGEEFTGEITRLDPVAEIELLPEWSDDPRLAEMLQFLESADSADVEKRAAVARNLADFRTEATVEALSKMATGDPEASVRSAAVIGLGVVDHESVFASILLALADEAREVRAAAARALSSLNFDRADAYTRLATTGSEGDLRNVARACVEAGLTQKAIERLASDDRRQAYESFALVSLMARAGEFGTLFSAVENHSDIKTRVAVVRVLGLTGDPNVLEELRRLSVREGLPEMVRAAISEVLAKIDEMQAA